MYWYLKEIRVFEEWKWNGRGIQAVDWRDLPCIFDVKGNADRYNFWMCLSSFWLQRPKISSLVLFFLIYGEKWIFEIDSITDCLRLVLKVFFCFENDNSMILFCFVFVILIPINIYIFKREMSLCYVFIACFPFFNFNRYVKCNP